MKRLILTSLTLAAALPAANAQRHYDYRNAPNGDCEVIDRGYQPARRPILDRIAHDLRVAKEEIDRGIFGIRDEVRRVIHGHEYAVQETYDYHKEADRYGRYERDDLSYHADESFGRFSPETLERARRRAAERDRLARRDAAIELELQRERARALAERTAPQQRRRPFVPNNDPRPIAPQAEPEEPVIVAPTEPTPRKEPAPRRNPAPEPTPQPRVEASPDLKTPPKDNDDREFTEAEKRNFPLATKTDKPGFVRSPYPPFELLDVTGIAPGDLAMEPEGDRIFRIPE